MSINLELPEVTELKPRINVIGVGGAGGNAVNNMIASGLSGVDFVVANTDAQALAMSSAEHAIQLGRHLTEGLGAGSKPEIGEAAAEEAIDDIKSQLAGSHMVFVAAGMGGGTGTGAAPVIARASKDQGILTVGVVTRPFQFEGARRMRIANAGIEEIRKHVDTLIVIPNQNLFRVANEKTTFAEAFVMADQVLHAGVGCITDLIVREGLINLDFADVKTVMSNMGTAMMGTGEATGERRAIEAAEEAIANPLLSEISMKGAKGLLVSISGGDDLTLYEVDEAASRVREEVDEDANIIVGATFDGSLDNRLRVSIVASGIGPVEQNAPRPQTMQAGGQQNGQVAGQPQNPPQVQPTAVPQQSAPLVRPVGGVVQQVRQAMAPQGQHGPQARQAPQPMAAPMGSSGTPVPQQASAMQMAQQPVDLGLAARPVQGGAAAPQGLVDKISEAMADGSDAGGFAPRAPSHIQRTPPQMPRVEDFPEVGQRALKAAPPVGASATQARAKKVGFLKRLTGRGKANQSDALSPQNGITDSHEVLQRGAENGGLPPSNRVQNVAGNEAGVVHNGVRIEPLGQSEVNSEVVEMPRFFRKDAR